MSHHQSQRKRSRWGDPTNQTNNDGTSMPVKSERSLASLSSSHVAVSDQEALNALLSSAQAKQQELELQQQRDHSYAGDGRKRRDGNKADSSSNDNKRSRNDNDKDRWGGGSKGKQKGGRGADYSYYGRGDDADEPDKKKEEEEEPKEKERANFGLSGALAQQEVGELKFREPAEARAPNTQWRLYVFKGEDIIETLHIAKQSAYLFGRNPELADITVLHPSASGQHAVLQYRALPGEDGRLRCQPYLMDLESTNGTFLNGVQLDPARYYQLKKGDVLKFGASTREYVLLTANTTSVK